MAEDEDAWIYRVMKWGHLACFVLLCLKWSFAICDFYGIAQIIQVIFVPAAYLCPVVFVIFHVKMSEHTWFEEEYTVSNLNWIRIWLMIEIIFFFMWIFASCIFVSYAYIFKVQSTVKDAELLEADDNIWNDRNTCDFLKFLKFEYFLVTYMFAILLMQIILCWTDKFGIQHFGVRDLKHTKIIFIILMVSKVNHILSFTKILIGGGKMGGNFKDIKK